MRLRRGLTQKQASKLLGLNAQAVQQYERGFRTPSIETLRKLAGLYGASLDDLLEVSPPTLDTPALPPLWKPQAPNDQKVT